MAMRERAPGVDRRKVLYSAAGALLAPSAAGAEDSVSIHTEKLHGRDAFTLTNGLLSVSVLPGGGFIADVHLVSRDPAVSLSPLRLPEYQTMDPYRFDLKLDGAKYGTGIQRRLMSGYMGHFTCFPQFGASRAEFAATGYGQHGELIISKWRRFSSSSPRELRMAAHLPLNQYDFERGITMLPGESVAYVTETASNLTGYERPLQWVQHVTMGPPFAETGKLSVDGSVASVRVGRGEGTRWLDWPKSLDADGTEADARAFTGHGATWLMQRINPRNWLAAYNENYNLLFGHIYDAGLNPWVLDWQIDTHANDFPVPGRVVARGLCWGDSPTASGVKQAVSEGKSMNEPTFSWIGSREKRSQSYVIFMAKIPPGWRGTADVSLKDGRIQVLEKETSNAIFLDARGVG
jgi:hypothetical protein